jgi:vancomycin permeability regulator SanA
MAQDTNLPLVQPADNFDQRVQDYFTNYFTNTISMTDMEYEAAKSFFVARTENTDAAAALTAATIEAANELNVSILDIIQQFEGVADLKSAVPTFLNLSRRSSSLLGYEQNITPNENIARQIEA